MPFKNYRPNGLNPLKLNKQIVAYKELYNTNHKLFCQRFIDTILSYHMDYFMDKLVQNQMDTSMLVWSIWETDMFLWKIRDNLDMCMNEGGRVMDAIRDEMLQIALDDFFEELVNQYGYSKKSEY